MTTKTYVNLIANFPKELAKEAESIAVPTLTLIRGLVGNRVHNQGLSEGGKKRAYKSAYYKKKYKKIDPVSMVKDGDLKRDYGIYNDEEGNHVLGFRDDLSIVKILAEEKRRDDSLFLPNDKEIERAQKYVDFAVKNLIKKKVK